MSPKPAPPTVHLVVADWAGVLATVAGHTVRLRRRRNTNRWVCAECGTSTRKPKCWHARALSQHLNSSKEKADMIHAFKAKKPEPSEQPTGDARPGHGRVTDPARYARGLIANTPAFDAADWPIRHDLHPDDAADVQVELARIAWHLAHGNHQQSTDQATLDAELCGLGMVEAALHGRRGDAETLLPDNLDGCHDAMHALAMLAASALTATGAPGDTLAGVRRSLIERHNTEGN